MYIEFCNNKQIIFNQSQNDDIPQEPENLRLSPIDYFFK